MDLYVFLTTMLRPMTNDGFLLSTDRAADVVLTGMVRIEPGIDALRDAIAGYAAWASLISLTASFGTVQEESR